MLRILLDQLRAAKYEWDASVAFPILARVHAVINAGAGSGVHVRGIRGIDDYAHHIGVVDHAFYNRRPVPSSVGGLPGKVIGPGVNRVFVLWIER